jgi:hypothetical protein
MPVGRSGSCLDAHCAVTYTFFLPDIDLLSIFDELPYSPLPDKYAGTVQRRVANIDSIFTNI